MTNQGRAQCEGDTEIANIRVEHSSTSPSGNGHIYPAITVACHTVIAPSASKPSNTRFRTMHDSALLIKAVQVSTIGYTSCVHSSGYARQWWAMAPMVRQRKTRNVKTCGASVCLGDSVGSRPPLSRSPWGPEASQGHRPWCSSSRLDAFYRKKWFIF
ncbi:uncharacterized protein LOC123396664 isoform X1 [Hordeum vulgare subsp. vulgare]|uniref:uncharacterized protein LOC123396664 isoform X1 n=1 Tax=Hordeum vulgare subsp. vulgare TaxID=112509 RepID=UPI001D1A44E3|nr:uncharacterized protein LOC123396664 isoform X1 [Hordeum vulgare subsp. vulgare]